MSEAVYFALQSETRRSIVFMRLPVRSDTASGRSINPAATAVNSGESQSISAKAPKKLTALTIMLIRLTR